MGPEVLVVASLRCWRLSLEAVFQGTLGGLLGDWEWVVVLLGDGPRDGSWLEVVLGPCPVPEDTVACWEDIGAEPENPVRGWG